MSTETKFTPGPWGFINPGGVVRHPQIYSDTGPVCNATWLGDGRIEELRANARLIAAAPLMHLSLANRSLLCDDDFEDIVAAIGEGDSEKLRDLWERVQAKARKV